MPEEQPAPYGRSGTCLPWHGAESNCNYSLLINSSAGKWGRAPSGGCGARGSHPTGTSPTSTVPPAHLTPRAGAPSPGSPPRAQHTPPRAPTSCRAASSPPTRGSPHLQPLLAVVYGPSLLRCSINSLTRSCFPRWRRDKAIGRKRARWFSRNTPLPPRRPALALAGGPQGGKAASAGGPHSSTTFSCSSTLAFCPSPSSSPPTGAARPRGAPCPIPSSPGASTGAGCYGRGPCIQPGLHMAPKQPCV